MVTLETPGAKQYSMAGDAEEVIEDENAKLDGKHRKRARDALGKDQPETHDLLSPEIVRLYRGSWPGQITVCPAALALATP